MNRRGFLTRSLPALIASPYLAQTALAVDTPAPLPPWQPGFLEIHHLATNRGNAAFLILPDGTTMMVDAGALYGTTPYLSDPRPDASRRPGEWIGRYIQRRLQSASVAGGASLTGIDACLLTHLHADHLGDIPPGSTPGPQGYIPTGVSDVAGLVPIRRIVDRAWPDYSYPAPPSAPFQKNYIAFVKSAQRSGTQVARFQPGITTQFPLAHSPATFPTFEIRNLAVNGEVWTGQGDATRKTFPDLASLKPEDYPSENCCSAAIRLRYGNFRYYTGGDLPSDTNYGRDPWRDIETPVAQVCGPVSVAVANHHGYFNANGPEFVRALRPQVFIIPAWDSAHPTVNVLNTLFSKAIYPAPRDVFATLVKQENRIANKKTDDLRSRNGHVVVRVEPGGATFRIHVLSNLDETDRVDASFGPYTA